MITFPLWFKILLGWFLLTMIFGIIRYFARDKYVLKLEDLPPEKKAKILRSYYMRIKIYTFFFWASPFYLIVIPLLIYKYSKQDFFHMIVLEILLFICILDDFLHIKFLAEKLKEN